jgi:predicted dehydrogenase
LIDELDSFVRHVDDDIELDITGNDRLNALRVCEVALRSSATRKRVNLAN